MKKKALIVLVAIYVVAMGWLFWRYQNQAPSRAASAFLNNISQKGDISAAYNSISAGMKQNYSSALFADYFSNLNGSKAKYQVLKQQTTGKNAIVSGVVEDLQGKNYLYVLHLNESSGHWLVDSMFANSQ